MAKYYWYISTAKLDQLNQDLRTDWLHDISLKLKFKSPFFEAEATNKEVKNRVLDVEKLENHLLNNSEVVDFENIFDATNLKFFSFTGHAARMITDDGYWISVVCAESAILLGGSPQNAIGMESATKEKFSPSINPIEASMRDFKSDDQNSPVSKQISYAFQEIMRKSGAGEGVILPKIEGICIYAGIIKANKSQMRRAGYPNVKSIFIATPIFIRQV